MRAAQGLFQRNGQPVSRWHRFCVYIACPVWQFSWRLRLSQPPHFSKPLLMSPDSRSSASTYCSASLYRRARRVASRTQSECRPRSCAISTATSVLSPFSAIALAKIVLGEFCLKLSVRREGTVSTLNGTTSPSIGRKWPPLRARGSGSQWRAAFGSAGGDLSGVDSSALAQTCFALGSVTLPSDFLALAMVTPPLPASSPSLRRHCPWEDIFARNISPHPAGPILDSARTKLQTALCPSSNERLCRVLMKREMVACKRMTQAVVRPMLDLARLSRRPRISADK